MSDVKHVEHIRQIVDLGATIVHLQNNYGADPLGAVEIYGSEVLPRVRGQSA